MSFSSFSYRFMAFYRDICASYRCLICSDAVAENSNDRKVKGTELYSTNLAADICLPKMVAVLLSHPKRQFYPSENNRYSFYRLLRKFQVKLY